MSKNGTEFGNFMIDKKSLPSPMYRVFTAIKLSLYAVSEKWKDVILAARDLRSLLAQKGFNSQNAKSAIEYICNDKYLYELACNAGIVDENGVICIKDMQRILGKNGLIDLERLRSITRDEVERIFSNFPAELKASGLRSDKEAAYSYADNFWFKPLSECLLANVQSMSQENSNGKVPFEFIDLEEEVFPEDLSTDHPLSQQVLDLFATNEPFSEKDGPDPAILLETEDEIVHYHPRSIYIDKEA